MKKLYLFFLLIFSMTFYNMSSYTSESDKIIEQRIEKMQRLEMPNYNGKTKEELQQYERELLDDWIFGSKEFRHYIEKTKHDQNKARFGGSLGQEATANTTSLSLSNPSTGSAQAVVNGPSNLEKKQDVVEVRSCFCIPWMRK